MFASLAALGSGLCYADSVILVRVLTRCLTHTGTPPLGAIVIPILMSKGSWQFSDSSKVNCWYRRTSAMIASSTTKQQKLKSAQRAGVIHAQQHNILSAVCRSAQRRQRHLQLEQLGASLSVLVTKPEEAA